MDIRCLSPHFDPSSSLIPRWVHTITRHDRRLQLRRQYRFPVFRCQFGLESFFDALNAVPALNFLFPVFGFASAASAFYLRHYLRPPDSSEVFGDWIVFTSPTPFNRCVLLRCPSILFEDRGELMNSVNDRLVREQRHYVNLTQGRIPLYDVGAAAIENDIKFQRVCVRTDDGGVIALDWPDYLNLDREHGLDTTVLIIPGTPEGSMDKTIKLFILDILKHGCFPIVMNPRGCGGSALTTPRLLTPADSEDVSTAIQFISEIRPWTTLMCIGWGYGANMLTKYLAETGETTLVTAAVCIDTPFDLEECTKSSSHHVALNEKLISGLREILRANKELFQGHSKGFDVAKALSATSVRDFDRSVSMISYGFDSLENFYRESCTRQLIDKLKIPTLFVQSDDGTIPLFSIPRSSITDNPFTSLLLCSCSHSDIKKGDLSAFLWSQQFAVEWLSAVEYALLKGHHPLLDEVNIAIKPSNGLAFNNFGAHGKSVSAGNRNRKRYGSSHFLPRNYYENEGSFMKITHSDAVNGFLVYPHNTETKGDGLLFDNATDHSKSGSKFYQMQRDNEHGAEDSKKEKLCTDKNIPTENVRIEEGANSTSSGGSEATHTANVMKIEEEANSISSGGSEVTHTANVIMNMLDVTMPGTLDDEHKRKVLSAMEQGESFLKALQGAVPEDVRGRITTSVTEIMHSKSTNLTFDAVKQIDWIPNVTSELKSKIQEKIKGSPPEEFASDDAGKSSGDGSEGNVGPSQEEDAQSSGSVEAGSEFEGNTNHSNKSDPVGGEAIEDIGRQYEVTEKSDLFNKISNQGQVLGDDVSTVDDSKETDILLKPSISKSMNPEESSSAHSSLHQGPAEEKGRHNNDVNSNQGASVEASINSEGPSPQLSSSKTHSVSVSQALDALTGFDDSTQKAVNSVFGVIENMIDQLEKSKEDVSEIKEAEYRGHVEGFNGIPDGERSNIFSSTNNGSGIGPDVYQPAIQTENIFNEDVETDEDKVEKSGYDKLKHIPASLSVNNTKQFDYEDIKPSPLTSIKLRKHRNTIDLTLDAAMRRYWLSPYETCFNRYFTRFANPSVLEREMTTDLFLDPEEGQWKMIDQPSNFLFTKSQYEKGQNVNFASGKRDVQNAVGPSSVIRDGEHSKCDNEVFQEDEDKNDNGLDVSMKEKLFFLIKTTLLDDLKVEVGRRKSVSHSKEFDSLLAYDLESFTDKVSQAVVSCSDINLFKEDIGSKLIRYGTVEGQQTVEIILSALQDAIHLREVLPSGVIVGTSLASLRTYFQVVALHGVAKKVIKSPVSKKRWSQGHENNTEDDIEGKHSIVKDVGNDEDDHHLDSNKSIGQGYGVINTVSSANDGIMLGAVTAALSASALLANRQMMDKQNASEEIPYDYSHRSHFTGDDYMQEKNQNSLASSLAEKAMSVAGPVMPTKGDGEVDHERLVAILAELGQKGGILRSLGKIALLWGGIRGAMSLTDRLISFLHLSERPLFQRVLGFVCMILVLWSPVVIPLLPTLVQSWTTHSPNRIVEFACIVGLYVASTFLIILWGKRIRGYGNSIEKYGLDLTSVSMVFDFLKGLAGGVLIVSSIHFINALLGYVSFSWIRELPLSPPRSIVLLKAYWSILLLTLQGIMSATGISIVEELFFRSWLAEEVAADLGYYRAIMISGLLFALIQRSLPSVPAFLLLSISLFGIKQRTGGKLAAPVGVRTGLMAANFVIQKADLLSYRADTPFWLVGTHPWHPLDGAVGISLCAALAIFFFPKPPHRPIRD